MDVNEQTVAPETTGGDINVETAVEEHNPYLEELKRIASLNKLVAGAKTVTFSGISRHVREERRAKNYRTRASRRINRLRAKGKL